jgi:hypothetical protein
LRAQIEQHMPSLLTAAIQGPGIADPAPRSFGVRGRLRRSRLFRAA